VDAEGREREGERERRTEWETRMHARTHADRQTERGVGGLVNGVGPLLNVSVATVGPLEGRFLLCGEPRFVGYETRAVRF
jgi:hypothetical protein